MDQASDISSRGVEGASGSGVNKTLTIIGNRVIMTPTVEARASKEVFGVEVRPNERWIGGSTVPLRVFQLFDLTQDANAYAEHSPGELADCCLSRPGRVRPSPFV